MKELNEKLLELINKSEHIVESQLPELISEYLQYGLYDNYLLLSVGLLLLVIVTVGTIFAIIKEQYDKGFSALIGGIILIIPIFMIGCAISEIIKIKIAPKVYIIEQFKN